MTEVRYSLKRKPVWSRLIFKISDKTLLT